MHSSSGFANAKITVPVFPVPQIMRYRQSLYQPRREKKYLERVRAKRRPLPQKKRTNGCGVKGGGEGAGDA
jgi:hypothetical protein